MQLPPHQPLLIADDRVLDAYLADVHGKNFASHRDGGIELADWLASGDDAEERSYRHAQQLGLPLVRLPEVAVDPKVAALLRP